MEKKKIFTPRDTKEVEELEKAYFLEQKPRLLFEIEQTLTLLTLDEIKILKSHLGKKEAKIIRKLEHNIKKGIEAIKSLQN